jgi:hypothetical protein
MRLKMALVVLGCFFLLLMGIQPDGLPFFRARSPYSDSVTAHWPNASFLRESVLEHHAFPLWRETTMAGQPFAANPLNKTAYPLQWLVLIFPPLLHLNLMIVLHLFFAGAGMWIWSRSLNFRIEAVVFSTVAYVFAPRMVAHLGAGHLDVVYAMAWFPWLMWSVRQLIRSPAAHKAILQTSLISALIILADVRVSLYALITALVYGVIELWRTRSWRGIGRSIVVDSIAPVLFACLIIPLMLWTPYVTRSDMSEAEAGVLSLEPVQFIGLILASQPPAVETFTYFGLPVLILAVVAFFQMKRRTRLGALGAALVIIFFAIGSNSFLWPTLVQIVPGLRWFRVPSRVWLIPALLIPVLAGSGLQWLLNYVEDRKAGKGFVFPKRMNLFLTACMAVVVISGIFSLVMLPLPKLVGLTAIVMGFGLGILLLFGLGGRIAPRQLCLGIMALTIIDLGVTAHSWVEWRGQDQWLDPERALAEYLVEAQAARIYSPTYSLEQQVAEEYGLRLFGGVDPFQLRGVVNAIEQGSGVAVGNNYSVVQPPLLGGEGDDFSQANRDAAINTHVLAEWDVSHVVAAYSITNDRLEFIDIVNGVSLYANLDYVPDMKAESDISGWPPGWAGLPDDKIIQRLNDITLVSWVVSMAGFVICTGALIFIMLREKRD